GHQHVSSTSMNNVEASYSNNRVPRISGTLRNNIVVNRFPDHSMDQLTEMQVCILVPAAKFLRVNRLLISSCYRDGGLSRLENAYERIAELKMVPSQHCKEYPTYLKSDNSSEKLRISITLLEWSKRLFKKHRGQLS
ncbi:hypothetical protein Tco_0976351, partial [Tanacetum coccineum]